MHRFIAELNNVSAGSIVELPADEAAHAARVLRLRPGERVGLLDGLGRSFAARLIEVGSRVTAEIVEPLPSCEPRLRVTLYQGLPKLDKLEWIIQKSTELGVDGIVPVRFSRCDARELSDERRVRGNRVAREASKQCGRASIPAVEPLITFERLLARVNESASPTFLLWEKSDGSCAELFIEHIKGMDCASLIVGPEGGIDETEAARLVQAGAVSVSLGSRILRTETAPVAALSILLSLSGDMG